MYMLGICLILHTLQGALFKKNENHNFREDGKVTR